MGFCISGGLSLYVYRGFGWRVSLALALFIVNQIVVFVLAKRMRPRFFILMESLSWLNPAILFALSAHSWDPPTGLMSLLMVFHGVPCFQLSNKLARVPGNWMEEAGAPREEIPPQNPVAS
jgi:hypothetical protein